MKKTIFAAATLIASAFGASAQNTDAVLMKVDGHDVYVSEFEYLYNKNNSQQVQQQSIDEYLTLFTNYKLKVADAQRNGLDKSPEFIAEFKKYRDDLATPYLRVQAVEDSLINEAYEHRKYDVYVSHIMLPLDGGNFEKADSLRAAIIAGTTTFEDVARKYSVDRGSSARDGRMGYVVPDRFPWPFEQASYNLSEGELSEVVNSGMGYHIIRVESKTPASGEVLASHILRLTRGKSETEIAAQKATIDSLYTVLKNGADFATVAKSMSEDPGSARNGGSLNYFSRGMMVTEFDSVAFSLKDGEMSEPFQTSFGYHIIKRFDHKGVPALDEVRDQIKKNMVRDARAKAPEEAKVKELMVQYNASIDENAFGTITSAINANGMLDSAMFANLKTLDTPVANCNGKAIAISKVVETLPFTNTVNADLAAEVLHNATENTLREAVLDEARAELERTNADYRNLVNEYRDGILLYEISNRNVWDRAAKDSEGLEAFFKANAAKYAWEKPKFKSFIIFAQNDSVLAEAVAYADSLSTDDLAKFNQDMRKRFNRNIKVERVIAAEGENPITDHLGFGAEKPASDTKNKWQSYAAYKGRVIAAPEEAADVRGAAVTDYQAKLEADWVKKLNKDYKVKLNKKVFKQLKERQEKK